MNNKGQVMIEGLLIGSLLIISLFIFIKYALMIQCNLLVDEYIEQTMICLVENKTTCLQKLKQKLLDLQFHQIIIYDQHIQKKIILNVSAISSFQQKIEKESEIELELTASY